MNKQEIRSRKKNRGQMARRRMLILLAVMLMITIGSVIFGSSFTSAQAQESELAYKYYKSIVIEKGDSLWSIAQEYMTSDYDNTQEYIEELIQLNSLTSETIHAGQHLLVAYYDTEFK